MRNGRDQSAAIPAGCLSSSGEELLAGDTGTFAALREPIRAITDRGDAPILRVTAPRPRRALIGWRYKDRWFLTLEGAAYAYWLALMDEMILLAKSLPATPYVHLVLPEYRDILDTLN